jgi:hypothetical protein
LEDKNLADITPSPDTLPAVGFNEDQLTNYILRRLGSPTWEVELTKQQCLDAIQDALNFYSIWRPLIRYQALKLTSNVNEYLKGVDLGLNGAPGLGIVDVSFVEPNPIAQAYFDNLIFPAPMMRTGMDEYDTFLRWRKTWMRVTSVRPDWLYDDARQCLYIHNPVSRYHCGLTIYCAHTLSKLPFYGADWVKRYATEKARQTYGEVLAKYSGALPSPVSNMQLDTQKRDKAEAEIAKLEAEIKAAQEFAPFDTD